MIRHCKYYGISQRYSGVSTLKMDDVYHKDAKSQEENLSKGDIKQRNPGQIRNHASLRVGVFDELCKEKSKKRICLKIEEGTHMQHGC